MLEGLLKENSEMLCKGSDESLFHLKPLMVVEDKELQGLITPIEKAPTDDIDVMGNFAVGSDRFFLTAPMRVEKDEGSLPLTCEIFKLNRRATVRLHIQPDYGMYMAITEFQGKKLYSVAQIADVSAGGARIFFSKNDPNVQASNTKKLEIRVGDKLKGVLHFVNNKTVEVEAEARHIQQAVYMGEIVDHIGLEFVGLQGAVKNRVISLTMDLQKKMVYED